MDPAAHERLLADTRWLQRLLERLVGDQHAAETVRTRQRRALEMLRRDLGVRD